MAKKKTHSTAKTKELDLELLIHKYACIYLDDSESLELVQKEGEEDSNFVLYDARRVYYPYYRAQVKYNVAKIAPLHPIIEEILKIIKELQTLSGKDNIATLKAITQLDSEIFYSILSDLETKGYVEIDNTSGTLKLSKNGREILEKSKERIVEPTSAFVLLDGIFGNVEIVAERSRDMILEDGANKEGIKLKPNAQKRPAKGAQGLHENYRDNESLEQVLRAGLEGLYQKDDEKSSESGVEKSEEDSNKSSDEYEIVEINEVASVQPFFKSYFCLFYKNASKEERILAINDKYEIDKGATKLFEDLIDTSEFSAREDEAYKDNIEKFKNLTAEQIESRIKLMPDLSDGTTLDTQEHPSYLRYALRNAKEMVAIHSPWVRFSVLEKYQDDIESALKRGVKVAIKYGLKPRNRFEKPPIDSKSKELFEAWAKEHNGFKSITDNNHSKILICDSEFMVIGSFNWLSFGGLGDKDNEVRGETSSVVRKKESIKKELDKF